MTTSDGLEIERKFLLTGLPTPPEESVIAVLLLDQGYYHDSEYQDVARVRRIRREDGTTSFVRTYKKGFGLVREEREDALTKEEFERRWTQTIGRRVQKRRRRIQDGELVWEIDEFLDRDLVLAEVELPSPDTPAPFPEWLTDKVDREVTDDPTFANSALAR